MPFNNCFHYAIGTNSTAEKKKAARDKIIEYGVHCTGVLWADFSAALYKLCTGEMGKLKGAAKTEEVLNILVNEDRMVVDPEFPSLEAASLLKEKRLEFKRNFYLGKYDNDGSTREGNEADDAHYFAFFNKKYTGVESTNYKTVEPVTVNDQDFVQSTRHGITVGQRAGKIKKMFTIYQRV